MGEAEEVGQEGVGGEGGLWVERELGGRGLLSVLPSGGEVQEEAEVGEKCFGGEGEGDSQMEEDEEALITEGGGDGIEEELGRTQAVEECEEGGGEFWADEDKLELVIEEGENS